MGLSGVIRVGVGAANKATQHSNLRTISNGHDNRTVEEPTAQVLPGGIPAGEITNMTHGYPQQLVNIPLAWIDPAYEQIYNDMYMRGNLGLSLRERFMAFQLSNAAIYSQALNRQAEVQEDPKNARVPYGIFRDPFDLIYLKNNVIPIKGVVDDTMADNVAFMTQHILAAMIRAGVRKPIHFQINSPGGSIVSMMSILEDMDKLKNTKVLGEPIIVATYCNGTAASAASVIFANGTPGHRYVGPLSDVMIHQPLSVASGRATAVNIRTKRVEKMKAWINEFFARTTKMKLEELTKVMEEDTFMGAEEAIEKGFADKKYERFATEQYEDFDLEGLFKQTEDNGDSPSLRAPLDPRMIFNPLDTLVLGQGKVK